MFSKSTAQALFPTLVWVRELESAYSDRLNAELERNFQRFIEAAPGESTLQTSHDLHQHSEFGELVGAINTMTEDILAFLEAEHSGFQISGCWANFGAPGADHITHNHVNNFLSGVYYVKAPPGGNVITFYDPRLVVEQIAPRYKKPTPHNSTFHNVRVRSGTMVMFPAWLGHSVPSNTSDEVRISISFNIIFSQFSETVAPPQWDGIPYKKRGSENE